MLEDGPLSRGKSAIRNGGQCKEYVMIFVQSMRGPGSCSLVQSWMRLSRISLLIWCGHLSGQIKKKVMIYDVVQMLVEGEFNPQTVAALAHRLQIPTSLMFMCCPGPNFPYLVADFGTRIIIL